MKRLAFVAFLLLVLTVVAAGCVKRSSLPQKKEKPHKEVSFLITGSRAAPCNATAAVGVTVLSVPGEESVMFRIYTEDERYSAFSANSLYLPDKYVRGRICVDYEYFYRLDVVALPESLKEGVEVEFSRMAICLPATGSCEGEKVCYKNGEKSVGPCRP